MKSFFFTFNTPPIYDVNVKFRFEGDRFPALMGKKKKICEIGHAVV